MYTVHQKDTQRLKQFSIIIDELQRIFDEGAPASEIACMIVEPFQGEGAIYPGTERVGKAVRKICDDKGILMIADEVQCGNCRTGRYYASEYWAEAGAAPDIITTAKSLGAGLPISAIRQQEQKLWMYNRKDHWWNLRWKPGFLCSSTGCYGYHET